MSAAPRALVRRFDRAVTLRARQARSRLGSRDDSGMTLVEVMIASTLLVVLLTSVMLTMNVLNTVSTSVSAQTQEFEQALPALAPMQTLLRAEVEPSVPVSNVPSPGFPSVGNFSLTFYSDIGTALNNVVAGPNGTVSAGPAKVLAEELDSSGAPVAQTDTCSTRSPCSFQVWQYLPVLTSGTSSCPVANYPPAQGQPTTCTYGAGKLIVNVLGITNNPNPSKGSIQPIFTYNVFNPSSGTGCNLTTTCSVTSSVTGTNYSCTETAPSGVTAVTTPCNDYIQSVGVELMIARAGAGTNGTVDAQSIIYRYPKPSTTSLLYPYQPSCFYSTPASCP